MASPVPQKLCTTLLMSSYLRKRQNQSWKAMKAALENEEVKNLIEQVQNDYQNALDADASLRAYVESIQ